MARHLLTLHSCKQFTVMRWYAVNPKLSASVLLLLALSSCALSPVGTTLPESPDRIIRAGGFDLSWYHNGASLRGKTVHVYLGGDGKPLDPESGLPSIDPTPEHAPALQLTALDRHESLFVARPCHYKPYQANCESSLWSEARYGETVVGALCKAIEQLTGGRSISLIGFSGGGALAVLLSHCLPTVRNVVTVNGNLATGVWTNSRGFMPLSASSDPVLAGLPQHVQGRLFLVGEKDAVVPPAISSHFSAAHGGEVLGFKGYGHRCCWLSAWPAILKELDSRFTAW